MAINSKKIGQNIKRFRLMNSIRQEDMAEKMGVSRATLINYEKGHTVINLEFLNRMKESYPAFEFEDKKKDIRPKIVDEDGIDFIVLYNVLSGRKKHIFLVTLLITCLGTSSSFFLKKQYQAEISLYPAKKDATQGIGQIQALAANFGINNPNADQNFNIPDVVKSRRIAIKAVTQKWEIADNQFTDLTDLWFKKNNSLLSITKFNSNIDSLEVIEKAIKKFEKHVKVSEDRISGLIKISTTFENPNLAASIANFIGDQVEIYIQKENSAQSKKEKLFISDRLFIVKNELEKSELDLKEFKERNRGYEDSPELFMIFSQLFREVEAKKQVYLTLQQQLELARIEEVKQSPILHVLDYAFPPIKKSFPSTRIFFLVSVFAGLLLSSLRTVFRY